MKAIILIGVVLGTLIIGGIPALGQATITGSQNLGAPAILGSHPEPPGNSSRVRGSETESAIPGREGPLPPPQDTPTDGSYGDICRNLTAAERKGIDLCGAPIVGGTAPLKAGP
jgi:hypothetical protein